MLIGMLLPVGIGDPQSVSGFKVLVLKRSEELGDDALFRPIADNPGKRRQNDDAEDCGGDELLAAASAARIVLRRFKESHDQHEDSTPRTREVDAGAGWNCRSPASDRRLLMTG